MNTLAILLLAWAPAATNQANVNPGQEPAEEVRSDWGLAESTRQMLVQRCAECHSPDSQDRKGRRAMADVGDLSTVIKDFVAPGDPDMSDLYFLIVDGDMPPPKSDVAPPSKQELALLHAWITGGAELPEAMPSKPIESTSIESIPAIRYLARSHPLWIHFPLALLPVALLAAALSRLLRKKSLETTAQFCVALALPAALFAVASGWLHAGENPEQAGVDLHRWTGVATAVACALALLVRKRPGLFLVVLAIASGIGGAAGHFGGRLTYGPDFFPW
ncbi:MAG: putative membrane protein/mono/diheme cytochrome c family protein [Planctomycetota bacterium]|jgi:uncharacterized membrane protein/mono/diheme cytochrome c family protein